MRVRYTTPASVDLDELLAYVATRSPEGARRAATRIRAAETLLAQFPRSGVPTRLSWLGRLKVGAYPYLIFYEVMDGEVVIHAVRHGARRPSSMPSA